ncbi:MAG TPA: lipid-A-disaccharide synthase [Rhodanobacteraceae bacterium]|nr:lipid-A-disaccharide synthase [Rhodanobacteraceae bacterium]
MTTTVPAASTAPLFVLVAGEASGDLLGADLIRAIRQRQPEARFAGIGGPRMAAADMDVWFPSDRLAVMGLVEVLPRLFDLLWLRRQVAARCIAQHPAAFIGIDAPDFNLGLEKRLKHAGIPTVHYVSPSVWAWRESRAARIGASADRVLCLFPMEPPIYARHSVDARFVGHPQADRFAMEPDRDGARQTLGLPAEAPVLAVLPGSRGSEIERLGPVFLDAAARVAAVTPGLQIVIPAANAHCHAALSALLARDGSRADAASAPRLLNGQAELALTAADVALVASGTATLETLLAKTPMVVCYRIAPLTYRIVRAFGLMKTDYYSLPNFLAGGPLVTELMQDDCQAEKLAAALLALFGDAPRRAAMAREFTRLHQQLRGPLDGGHAADHAAAAILDLLSPLGATSAPSPLDARHD